VWIKCASPRLHSASTFIPYCSKFTDPHSTYHHGHDRCIHGCGCSSAKRQIRYRILLPVSLQRFFTLLLFLQPFSTCYSEHPDVHIIRLNLPCQDALIEPNACIAGEHQKVRCRPSVIAVVFKTLRLVEKASHLVYDNREVIVKGPKRERVVTGKPPMTSRGDIESPRFSGGP
jgi:hypothetical protein